MAVMDLTEATEQLSLWLAASRATSSGLSYSIGNRSLTRADTAQILSMIEYWSAKQRELTAAGAGATSPAVMTAKFSA